jgi:hypothetical protein
MCTISLTLARRRNLVCPTSLVLEEVIDGFFPAQQYPGAAVLETDLSPIWPLNSWPKGRKEKLIALWSQQNLLDGINAMSMAVLTRLLGWTKEEVELLLVYVRKDIRNRHIHAYIDV